MWIHYSRTLIKIVYRWHYTQCTHNWKQTMTWRAC